MSKQNISIIGLPAAGKTTYIAALWALMINNSPYCSLALHSLKHGNHEYLNKIGEDWASFQKVGRTMLANVGEVVMNLTNKSSGEIFTLNIPDFHGELFDAHFKDREWTKDYFDLMEQSNQFIIFIDPYAPNNVAQTIMNEIEQMEQFSDLDIDVPTDNNGEKEVEIDHISVMNPKVYQHINTSNQVKIVEILQYLIYTLDNNKPLKIAIIVSKWDTVTTNFPDSLPNDVIKRHLPLLYQFLQCNEQSFNIQFFGVSAQGGDYDDNIEMMELVNKIPDDRVVIYNGIEYSKDIATPITWLTE